MEYSVGMKLQLKDQEVLITRQVNSTSLFENDDKTCYIITELYLEWIDDKGNIGFIPLSENSASFEKPADVKIKGPAPLPWRK